MEVKDAIALIKQGKSVGDVVKQMTLGIDEDHAEGQDVYVTVAFFIRCLEWAREEAKDDVVLHKFAEAVFSKSHPEGSKEGTVVRSVDYDGILKQANEMCSSSGVSGFTADVGSAKPGKSKKKRQKAGMKEAAESRGSIVAEFYDRENPSMRIELDCLQHALATAGEEKYNKKKARDVTNAVARKTAGTYSAMTKYDFKEALQTLEDAEDD